MTRRERLEELRDQLAEVLAEGVGARDFAAVSREYRAVLAEIEVLESGELRAGDPVDEIASRRAARGAVAAPLSRRTAAHPR